MNPSESCILGFALLCEELNTHRRLSPTALPPVEPTILYEALRDACENKEHALRRAVKESVTTGLSLVDAVANTQPAETFSGVLDGKAIISAVMALLVCEFDETARSARALAQQAPDDELEVVCQNTDTNPFSSDPDAVQLALLAFLKGSQNATAQLAAAAYGRSSDYGSKAQLFEMCSAFLEECGTLLEPSGEKETVTETFYTLAERPFAQIKKEFVALPAGVSGTPSSSPPPASPSAAPETVGSTEPLSEDEEILRALGLDFSKLASPTS